MKPSKRELWKAVEEIDSTPGDIPDVTSEVVTVTDFDSDPEPVEVPADAELLETDSDVVTWWITDA